ncbi:hypothetical protein GEMRC1_006759 [Eukaryota sp. GEM-RC1]
MISLTAISTFNTTSPPGQSFTFLVKLVVKQSFDPHFSLIAAPYFDGHHFEVGFPFAVKRPFIPRSSISSTSKCIFLDFSLQPSVSSALALNNVKFQPSSSFQSEVIPSLTPIEHMAPSDLRHFLYKLFPTKELIIKANTTTLSRSIDIGYVDVSWVTADQRVGNFVTRSFSVSRDVIQALTRPISVSIDCFSFNVVLGDVTDLRFKCVNNSPRVLSLTIEETSSHNSFLIENGLGNSFKVNESGDFVFSVKIRVLKRGYCTVGNLVLIQGGYSIPLPSVSFVVT